MSKTSALSVQLSTQEANPYQGLKNCLKIFQEGGKGTLNISLLNSAWNEVKDDKEKREMFFSLLFSIGDITARQHNIFKGNKVDSGGNAQREVFHLIYDWLKINHFKQWKKFLFSFLFNEYISFDLIFANRVKTSGKKNVVKTYSAFTGTKDYMEALVEFTVKVIKGKNPTHKYFLSKFLTRPRTSVRKGHKTMLPDTANLMMDKQKFLVAVSEACGFEYKKFPTYFTFPGYIEWRKEYLGELESVLFSSKKILEFDREQFIGWLEKLPSSARFRVRCRLLTSDNKPKVNPLILEKPEGGKLTSMWGNLPQWFLEWESYKETKQTEQRVIEEKVRQGVATEREVKVLEKVKKEAKVTTGAFNFQKEFSNIIKGIVDKVKIQPFLDKISLPYNTLVFMDDSSSMQSYGANGITAFEMATFIATMCLTKNPDDVGRSLMGFFSNETRLFRMMTSRSETVNKLVKSNSRQVKEDLINPTLHFLDNLKRIREFANSVRTGSLTNIGSIPYYLRGIIDSNPDIKEQLQDFPVWTLISDGNFNSLRSPEASLNAMLRELEDLLGFRPYLIIIDVANASSAEIDRFSGIDGVMYIPPNPAQIEQFLINYQDFKVYDIYTPLESLAKSNRYALVRENTI